MIKPNVIIKGNGYSISMKLNKTASVTNSRKVMNRTTQKLLGRLVIKEMKRRIAKGLSPVKGEPKYAPYASKGKSKSGKNRGYPNTPDIKKRFPNKKSSPVNLELSGKWLKKLRFRRKIGGITVGWLNPTKLEKALIETHNQGLHPHVPKRKVLPTDPGDDYAPSIKRIIKKVVLDRIKSIINK
jgi:hypothetical protein